ncbi:MAG: hypothetical protein JSS66_13850 [Armatimonadetes bacterium]|nr:hypothetical protein [Armatimonadota bacterium]
MRTLIVLAALGSAAYASAQAVGTPTNLAFRLGYAYPIDNETRDLVRNFIGVGADYFFERGLLQGGETTISLDWLGKSGSGAKGNIFPICLNQRWYSVNGMEPGRRSYFQLGAGVAIVDVTSTKTVLAGRAGYGVEFGEHIFGELNFFFSDDANGARATSIGAYLGYRF